MENSDSKKKPWIKPEVHVLNIKKDTFSGGSFGDEQMTGKGKIVIP